MLLQTKNSSSNTDDMMLSGEFSFCHFIILCVHVHVQKMKSKETFLWCIVTWSVVEKQNVQAEENFGDAVLKLRKKARNHPCASRCL